MYCHFHSGPSAWCNRALDWWGIRSSTRIIKWSENITWPPKKLNYLINNKLNMANKLVTDPTMNNSTQPTINISEGGFKIFKLSFWVNNNLIFSSTQIVFLILYYSTERTECWITEVRVYKWNSKTINLSTAYTKNNSIPLERGTHSQREWILSKASPTFNNILRISIRNPKQLLQKSSSLKGQRKSKKHPITRYWLENQEFYSIYTV